MAEPNELVAYLARTSRLTPSEAAKIVEEVLGFLSEHGPLALIAPQTPTVVVMPRDDLFSRNVSTVEEIRARGGPILAITHAGDLPVRVEGRFDVPRSEPELDPLLLNIPLQLLAYHVALQKGRDIDKPRNLAKSVTVE